VHRSYEILDGKSIIYRHRAWEASTSNGHLLGVCWALAAELYLILKGSPIRDSAFYNGCNPPDTIFLIGLVLKAFGVGFIFDHQDLPRAFLRLSSAEAWAVLYGVLTRLAENTPLEFANVSIATNESLKEVAVTRGGKCPEQVFVVRKLSRPEDTPPWAGSA